MADGCNGRGTQGQRGRGFHGSKHFHESSSEEIEETQSTQGRGHKQFPELFTRAQETNTSQKPNGPNLSSSTNHGLAAPHATGGGGRSVNGCSSLFTLFSDRRPPTTTLPTWEWGRLTRQLGPLQPLHHTDPHHTARSC